MSQQFSNNNAIAANNQIGNRTFFWFRAYCLLLTFLYVIVAALGAYLAIEQPTSPSYDKTEIFITGIVYFVVGVALIIPFGYALFLPRRRWAWVYGIVLIALGMSSCCFLPVTIPLLIFWLKPETKAIFGR